MDLVSAVVIVIVLMLVSSLVVAGLVIRGLFKGAKAVGRYLAGRKDPRRVEGPHGSQGPRRPNSPEAGFSSYDASAGQSGGGPKEPAGASGQARAARARAGRAPRRENNQGARARDYEYLDVERGTTPERIAEVMREYVDDYVAGDYAQAVIEALDAAKFRRRSLIPEIESKFEPNTISWERFMAPAEAALQAVVRNCALLANRVQSFDSTDYARMEEFYSQGGFDANGGTDPARLQRWKLLYDTKREMDDIRSTNEELLYELGKLSAELGKLSSTVSHDEGARIAEEVGKLVDETKYYQ